MHLKDMQRDLDAWIAENGGYWDEMVLLGRLTEEVGELARTYLHHFGPKTPKPGEDRGDLEEELADVLWITLCLANQQGVDMEAAFQRTMDKFRVRDAGRHA